MKLRTGLLLLVVGMGLAYGGTKVYLHAKAKEKLDQWAVMIAPFAELTYGDIDSDLRGSLAVDELYLSTPDGAVVQIGRTQIVGSGPGFLVDLVRGFDQQSPPDEMVLKIERLTMPVDQSLRSSFGIFGDDANHTPQVQPCTLGGLFRYAGVDNIGMQQVVADAVVGYSFDERQGSANLFFDYDLDSVETLSLSLALEGLPEAGAVVMGRFPGVTEFELVYQMQPDYARRMVGFCAEQRKLSPAEFLSGLFSQSDGNLQRNLGFVPGPGLRRMLQQLLSEGGVVQISVETPDRLDPSQLFAYRMEQIVELLGIEVAFNDKPIDDLSIEFALSEGGVSAVPGWSPFAVTAAEAEDELEELEEDASTPASRDRMQYVGIGVNELPRHLGSSVRLYTNSTRRPKQGSLVSYRNGVFSVEQSVHRGKMTAHVDRTDLVRAEVLRSVPIEP